MPLLCHKPPDSSVFSPLRSNEVVIQVTVIYNSTVQRAISIFYTNQLTPSAPSHIPTLLIIIHQPIYSPLFSHTQYIITPLMLTVIDMSSSTFPSLVHMLEAYRLRQNNFLHQRDGSMAFGRDQTHVSWIASPTRYPLHITLHVIPRFFFLYKTLIHESLIA